MRRAQLLFPTLMANGPLPRLLAYPAALPCAGPRLFKHDGYSERPAPYAASRRRGRCVPGRSAASAVQQHAVYGQLPDREQAAHAGPILTATTTGAGALANVQVQAAMGRMFDQATDVLAVAAQEPNPADPAGRSLYVTIYDRFNNRLQRVFVLGGEVEMVPTSVLMADLTGDGYDDLAVSFNQAAPSGVTGFTTILTAADPQNWAAGLVVGPLYFNEPIPVTAFEGMTAADVEGDGQLEIVATLINTSTANGPQLVVLGDAKCGQHPRQARDQLCPVQHAAEVEQPVQQPADYELRLRHPGNVCPQRVVRNSRPGKWGV